LRGAVSLSNGDEAISHQPHPAGQGNPAPTLGECAQFIRRGAVSAPNPVGYIYRGVLPVLRVPEGHKGESALSAESVIFDLRSEF